MNWKALLITIGIFIGFAAFIWLCIVLNAGAVIFSAFIAFLAFLLFYAVYSTVKDEIELHNEEKQRKRKL